MIRKLLGATRVLMTPLKDGTCEISGRADYGKLFSGILVATAVTSLTVASWSQIAAWLRQLNNLRAAARDESGHFEFPTLVL